MALGQESGETTSPDRVGTSESRASMSMRAYKDILQPNCIGCFLDRFGDRMWGEGKVTM